MICERIATSKCRSLPSISRSHQLVFFSPTTVDANAFIWFISRLFKVFWLIFLFLCFLLGVLRPRLISSSNMFFSRSQIAFSVNECLTLFVVEFNSSIATFMRAISVF